jgi:hypothetical protein
VAPQAARSHGGLRGRFEFEHPGNRPAAMGCGDYGIVARKSADLTPTVIKVLGAFSRVSKLFGIEVLCTFKWAIQYSNHSVNQIPSVLNDEYSSRPP